MKTKFKTRTITIWYDLENDKYISDYEYNVKHRGKFSAMRFVPIVKEVR